MNKEFLSALFASVSAGDCSVPEGGVYDLYEMSPEAEEAGRLFNDALDRSGLRCTPAEDDLYDAYINAINAHEKCGFINGFRLGMKLAGELGGGLGHE